MSITLATQLLGRVHAREHGDTVEAFGQLGIAHAFELGTINAAILALGNTQSARDGQSGQLAVSRHHDWADTCRTARGHRNLDFLARRIDLAPQAKLRRAAGQFVEATARIKGEVIDSCDSKHPQRALGHFLGGAARRQRHDTAEAPPQARP